MIPPLSNKPKMNLKENNDLTMVVSNGNIDKGESDPGRKKPRISHPSGKSHIVISLEKWLKKAK